MYCCGWTGQQVQSIWTRNDRNAPKSLTHIWFCRISLVASSSSGMTPYSSTSPKFSERPRAVSMLAPSLSKCFAGFMSVSRGLPLHIELVSMTSFNRESAPRFVAKNSPSSLNSEPFQTVFDRCTMSCQHMTLYRIRSLKEATQNCTAASVDQSKPLERLATATVA